ncbi:MAG: DinB family protein [Dehalococcoidia bacterium]
MSVIPYMKQSINFLQESFRTAGNGLTPEQLHFSPDGESHSIAWVQWHAARIEDLFIQQIFQSKPAEWDTGGWAQRTGLPEKGFGTGQPTEEAKAIRITGLDAFAQYAATVAGQTNAFLDSLDEKGLEREVKLGERTETVGESINLHFITHLNGHRGEVNLLRGTMGFQPVMPNRGG